MVTVNLHSSLQRFTEQQRQIKVSSEQLTIHSLLQQIVTQYPALASILLTHDNKISPYLVVYLNGQDIRDLNFQQQVDNDAVIDIICALVGG